MLLNVYIKIICTLKTPSPSLLLYSFNYGGRTSQTPHNLHTLSNLLSEKSIFKGKQTYMSNIKENAK